jgi:hypothetical protein
MLYTVKPFGNWVWPVTIRQDHPRKIVSRLRTNVFTCRDYIPVRGFPRLRVHTIMSLEFVIEAIKAKRCLPFLGAGASAGYSMEGREVPGIPLGGKLCEKIAAACGYPNGSTNDLSPVRGVFRFSQEWAPG